MAGDGELIAGRYYISPEQRAELTPEQYAKLKRSLEEDAPVDDFLEELQQRAEDGSMSTDELRHWVTELDRLRAASARGGLMSEGQQYIPGEELAAKLTKQSDKFRSDLKRAVRWWFCKGDPGKPPLELPDINAAQLLIANREDFEGRREDVGADTLANAGSFKDPWHEPIIKLGRAVGLPFDEACLFAEGLIARGIVDIVPAYTGLESPGEQSFGELKQWCVAKRRTAQNQKEANKEKARRGRATNGIG